MCILLMLFTAIGASADPPAAAGQDDVAPLRIVLEHFRLSWLANDPDGVRSCFTQDAVLMPHHGVQPVVGMKAINDFWFPSAGPKTTILRFNQTVDEVRAEGSLAYLRGRSEVAWRIEGKATSEEWRNGGNYLAILKKQANGKWLISHLIWDDPPNERTK